MMIREPTHNLSEPRILKVRLPTETHLRLHSLKILTGKSISDAVGEALQAYFSTVLVSRPDRDAPAPAPGEGSVAG